ncbi:MAG: hypothetical protein BGN86_07395 [Caulobacterales bacterium 68-7]|nr:MAG: hypothetical protein BGN86_07395 [Caulobacterales bacterium 68-7]
MSEFSTVEGFEDAWRAPVRPLRRSPTSILGRLGTGPAETRSRLQRLVRRAPEVMVKVTGRTHDAGHLKAHLDYISRNASLDLEDQDGCVVGSRRAVAELAEDWSLEAEMVSRRGRPFSHSIVLSMPEGADPLTLRDAARAVAADLFEGRHDYVFVLHTDTPRPHVHLTVSSQGRDGQRLNPKKADLEHWRQVFAQALRERGVEAEATPRRARGLSRRGSRIAVRKIADRKSVPTVRRAAFRKAAKAAFQGDDLLRPWEQAIGRAQAKIRATYLAQAQLLARSGDTEDRQLAADLARFVQAMPPPESQRQAMARALVDTASRGPPERGRER